MAHFAKVDQSKVIKVIVAEQDYIDNLIDTVPGNWIQTSYNTHAGVHKNGGTPLRKNFAGIGMIYDAQRDAFYEQQPYSSWTLNETTCMWEPPTPRPNEDRLYSWNESTTSWDVVAEPS